MPTENLKSINFSSATTLSIENTHMKPDLFKKPNYIFPNETTKKTGSLYCHCTKHIAKTFGL